MRRILINLFCLLIPASFFAQELSENLESYQVTVVGDQILLSGFKTLSKDPVFEVYLCDKNLAVKNQYSKTLPVASKSYYTSKSADLFVFTFYGTGDKEKYRIALDANLLEKYASAPDEKVKKITEADKTIFVSTDWTYDGSYANDYIIGNLLIDAQMDGITCYSAVDPVQGTYKTKWEKDFEDNATYVKMELLGVQDRTAYFLAVESIPQNVQKFFSINIDDGTVLFSTELNESDSLDAVSVSSFFIKGNVIYLAGTYVAAEQGESYAPTFDDFSDNEKRGYENLAPYIISPADGYFIMTIDTKGAIQKMKTFGFPDIDKTVDYRDFRLAVCHGITPLANGKMLAFFEMISSPYNRTGNQNGGSVVQQQLDPKLILWETDGFTSVIFNPDMSDFNSTTMKWEEESSDYDLYDYDLFSLAPMQEIPHDFCTLGDEGAYPQNFVCDGTTWIYHVKGATNAMPDYLIKITETDQKAIKLLPPGLLLLRDNKSGIQVKETGQSVKLKILAIE